MKKSLIALATLAATASFAQSSVEIYGVIDQSYSSLTAKGTDPTGFDKTTVTTTGNQSGLATQRIGFRGTEDLGGGLRARFQIESSLTAGNAGANAFGSRPTFVGLQGGFGTVLLGRQDTPLLKAVVPQLAGGANNVVGQMMWSPLNVSLYDAAATPDAGFGRIARETTIDRAVNYITPTINGFTAELQYGQNSTKETATGVAATDKKTTDTGLNVRYAAGPLTLAAATHDQKANNAAGTAAGGRNQNDYVGATYNLGFANVSLQHGVSKRDTAGVQNYKNKGTQLGVQVPVSGALNAFASYGTGSRTIGLADKYENTSFQAGATYAFSKRTRVYAIYGQQNLKGDSVGTRGEKWKENQFALGVNHNF